jgi:hypothetical protein
MATPPPNEQLAVTVADGNDAALGTTTDATSDNTVIGRLKNLLSRWPAALTTAGSLKVAVQADAGGAASYAACPAATDTAVKASAGTLLGVIATGTGTAGTVALKDGSTTYLTAGIPAAVTTIGLPLPPSGIAHATNIHVVTTGTGVTAAAAYI